MCILPRLSSLQGLVLPLLPSPALPRCNLMGRPRRMWVLVFPCPSWHEVCAAQQVQDRRHSTSWAPLPRQGWGAQSWVPRHGWWGWGTFFTFQLEVLLKTGSTGPTSPLALHQWYGRLWIGLTAAQLELQSLYLTKLSRRGQRRQHKSLQGTKSWQDGHGMGKCVLVL